MLVVFADHKLKKISVAGGAPVTLCDAPNSRGGAWADDDTIYFVAASPGGLLRIPAAGGQPSGRAEPLHVLAWQTDDALYGIKDHARTRMAGAVDLETQPVNTALTRSK